MPDTSPPSSRSKALQERFDLIAEALKDLHGRDLAFCAESAAWLQAIEYFAILALRRARTDPDTNASEAELREILMSFHNQLCKYLAEDQVEAIDLARSFREVVDDICRS